MEYKDALEAGDVSKFTNIDESIVNTPITTNLLSEALKMYSKSTDPALRENYLNIILLLIENGGANKEESLRQIITANGRDNYENAINLLLDLGANPDEMGSSIQFAFFQARERSPENIIKILIDKGANINMQDDNGNTLLHIVILTPELSRAGNLVTYLIDNGADVNIQNNEGDTPLHHACFRFRHFDSFSKTSTMTLIGQLVAVNADTDIRNNRGFKPIDLVRRLPIGVSSIFSLSDKDKEMIEIMLTKTITIQIQNAVSVDALSASSLHEMKEHEKHGSLGMPINKVVADPVLRTKIKEYLRPSPNTLRGLLGERVYDSYVDSARRFLYPYPYPQQTANAGVVATTERNKPSKGGKRKMKTMKRKMKKTMKRKM